MMCVLCSRSKDLHFQAQKRVTCSHNLTDDIKKSNVKNNIIPKFEYEIVMVHHTLL